MSTNSHNLNSVNGIDPQSAAHATAAEARPRETAGPICSDSMGYDAAQISVSREIDYEIPSEVPSHRAIPIPIRSEAHHMIEHGSVPSSFVGQGSLPLFGLELDPSPVRSTLERRGSQLHGIPHRGAVPFVDTPRLLHFGPVGKGETASHDQDAGSAERVKMSRTGKVEPSGAADHATDYARPSSCNQNVTVDHGVCTDKRDVPKWTASTAGYACEEDMASVVKLLQDAIPKLTNSVCRQCAASPAALTSAEDAPQPTQGGLTSSGAAAATPPQAFVSGERITPALSPVLIVGHHLPSVPIIAIEPSTPLVRSPRVWHSGSCFLLPHTEERTPLLGSFARVEYRNSNHAATHIDHSEMLPSSRQFRFSRGQIMILISMLLVDFSSFASMSIMAPFFPHQVDTRGLSPTVDGIIFSVYAFVIVLVSPVIGKTLPLMDARSVYMAGIIIAGIANICFGFVVHVKNPEMFVVVAITLRVLVAFGSACFLTVIYTLVPVLFPDDMNTVNGMLETAVGVGMCVGPAVGVWLYSLGGFCLPFYGLGSFILLTVPVNMLTFPKRVEVSPEFTDAELAPVSGALGLTSILRRPGAVLPLAILSVTAVCLAVLYPTLQPHMHGLGVSVEGVGLVFLLMSAVYAVSSPLVGLATDRYKCPCSFMLAGLLLLALALILIGNSPLLPNVTHDMLYKQDVVAVVVIGLASAMSIVPTFASILYVLGEDGTVDVTTFSLVGGMWSAAYSLGEMLGPFYAGMMAEYVNFATSTTVTALLPASLAVVQAVYMCMECYRSRGGPSKSTVN